MIFKHLFTPKWKHPKLQVRVEALSKLDVEKDSAILTTMAKEDSAPEIRRQALAKLNSLGLWWHAFKQDQALKDVAEQQIATAVVNDNLETQLREEYIEKHAPNKLLEKLALTDNDSSLRLKLLKRLSDSSLIEKAFKESEETLQNDLLQLIEQHQLLKSALKHAKGSVQTKIESRLSELKLAEEMPEKVQQETKLVLAKLNHLREKNDWVSVSGEFDSLVAQWSGIEMQWLTEVQQEELSTKYASITEKTERHLERLREVFDVEQAKIKAQQAKSEFELNVNARFEDLKKRTNAVLQDLDDSAVDTLVNEMLSLQGDIESSDYRSESRIEETAKALIVFREKLANLPAIAQNAKQAKLALDALAKVEPPLNVEQLDSQLAEFDALCRTAKDAIKLVPREFQTGLQKTFKSIVQAFNQAHEVLSNEQKDKQQTARKKAFDTKRLIENGRFNVAFGVFKGFLSEYEGLTTYYQTPLNTLKEELTEKLQDLQDWQKYATEPKRDSILNELAQLAEQTTVEPAQRAKQVKALRLRWNECGPILNDETKALAERFEQQIERAFEPCRSYFAEQEAQRKQNEESRLSIINALDVLAQSAAVDSDLKALESGLQALKQQWKEAGKVDQDTYLKLSQQYKSGQDAIWLIIKSHYEANTAKKEALLASANAELENDDVSAACEHLKDLQQQWQLIGFAGAKNEHRLWQAFRAVNDAVFAKRQEQIKERRAEQSLLLDSLRSELEQLNKAAEEVKGLKEINDILNQLNSLSVPKTLRNEQNELRQLLAAKLETIQAGKRQADLEALFEGLEMGQLPEQWKKSIVSSLSSDEMLIRLEILSDVESPEMLKDERVKVQIAMLEEKLSGSDINNQDILKGFINSCPLPIESEKLVRLKRCMGM
ncbi:DUF349 domain-containing protein [Pseudoalteromonas xiamenensis]|uniref:DUF349 domain-containing protein n=1 Tax=Pseudoalteromonas xiamenensis TaxID=882626 RepID=UPI0035E7637C